MTESQTQADRQHKGALGLVSWLVGERVGEERARLRFERQAERGGVGFQVHLVLACAWCFFVTWPVTYVELAGIPLIAWTFFRVVYTFGLSLSILRQPLTILCCLFWIWNAASLLWTPDTGQGVIQAGQARWLWSLFMLWPVIERRGWLISFLALGFFAGNCSQLAHAFGTHFDVAWLKFDRQPDRNSGWWQPVVGGTLLCAAVGLHLPGILLEQGRLRLVAIAGTCASFVGILATGSRGAWLAGAATLAVGLPVAAIIGVRRGRFSAGVSPKAFAGGAVVLMLVLVFAGITLKGPMVRRYELARNEIASALDKGDYSSDTGARIWMAQTALKALREHPLAGIGVGGFRAFCRAQLAQENAAPLTRPSHAHAHNTYLQIGATLGIVGLALGGLVVFVALWNGLGVASRDLSRPYALGPGFAVMGMLFAGVFDSIHVNTQTCALLLVLCALCPSYLPKREQPSPGAARPIESGP